MTESGSCYCVVYCTYRKCTMSCNSQYSTFVYCNVAGLCDGLALECFNYPYLLVSIQSFMFVKQVIVVSVVYFILYTCNQFIFNCAHRLLVPLLKKRGLVLNKERLFELLFELPSSTHLFCIASPS